uniref:Putative nuclease HARBI1 n=1 Tax=Anthurium amnicola TaxID=1678845 RepID=A0A1D1XSX7_9ARAE
MDPSVLLMLSNLLHLHNHLDPLLSDSASPSSANLAAPAAVSSCCSSSPAPLLFLAIASVLSYASSTLGDHPGVGRRPRHRRRRRRRSPTSPAAASSSSSSSSSSASPSPPPPPAPSDGPLGLSAFQSLSSGRIWSMDPAARDARWRSHYGLSYPVFATLVDHLKPHLRAAALPIPADYAVSVALTRLSRGLSPRSLARHHQLPPPLISKVTNAVTRLLSTKLYPDYVRIPAGQRLLQTIQSFRDITSLPNMCGAIDGSPIKLRRPPPPPPPSEGGDGSAGGEGAAAYQCRHGYPAILLQVVADARKIFWDVCVKAPGSSDDASHFRDSLLYNRLTAGEILRDAVFSVRGHHVRPYVVGDWAYPLMSFLLTPFTSDGNGTPVQNAFDAAVLKGRAASVEAALGMLKGRWRILRDLNVGINHAAQTVVACCVLHNMCQIAGEPEDEDVYVWRDPKESAPSARALDSERSFFYFGENLRQAIADDLYERQQRLSAAAGAR